VGDADLRKDSHAAGAALCVFILLSQLSALVRDTLLAGAGDAVRYLSIIVMQTVSVMIPYCIIRARGRDSAGFRAFTEDEAALVFPAFLSFFFIYFTANLVSAAMFRYAGISEQESAGLPEGGIAAVLFFISYAVLPAVLEELLFRRALIGILKPYGKWFSISVSSLFFALSHWEAVRVMPVFFFAILLGLSYTVTDNLLVPAAVHLLNNTLAFANIYISERIRPELAASVMLSAVILGFISLTVLIVILPLGQIFPDSGEEKAAEGRKFFSGPVLTAIAAFAVIIIASCGVFT